MASQLEHNSSTHTPAPKRIVILLRDRKGPEDPYHKAFLAAGFKAVSFIPVLHYEHINKKELRSDLLNSDRFSGIVLTSQTAVEVCCCSLAQSERVCDSWSHLPVFVVGRATAQAVGQLGLKATGSHSGNAESLSRVILEYFSTGVPAKPLLFPCASQKRETLPLAMEGAGLPLKCLTCYQTLAHPEILTSLNKFATQIREEEELWVVFFSPSGVNFALEYVRTTFKSKWKAAAIGRTTGDSLCETGHSCEAVAKQPNPESLVEAILQCHGGSQS